jgi:type 1 glutamine amidotransferase
MRVLVICDDYWHPASTVREGLTPLGQRGFQFDWIEHAAEWSVERMAHYPVVLLAKSDEVSSTDRDHWVTDEVQSAFLDYVSRGKGLLVVHSGTVYAEVPAMRALIGGVFASHPEQCPVTVQPLAGHPLTAGSAPFKVLDEHYFVELDDEGADRFLATRSVHGTQPGGWTRLQGEGRVCVLTPGHNAEVWRHPCYQALLSNALRWCGSPSSREGGRGLFR